MRWFMSASVKNVWWRSRARIQRWATSTPASTLALSRAAPGRAGKITVP